ncbi:CinA family protein [Corynebacterium spheniscorum]|nr:CinA family protein [Corynebacterium spheniscorum]
MCWRGSVRRVRALVVVGVPVARKVALPELLDGLAARGETLATCESLTAGMLAATIAGVPGASRVLRGGLVTYATELKSSLAHVDWEILEAHGVISAECARAMARGAREVCGADWAISLTGVAGPDRQDDHPVGEVHVGVAGPEGLVVDTTLNLDPEFSRNEIRELACQEAIAYFASQLFLPTIGAGSAEGSSGGTSEGTSPESLRESSSARNK